MGKKADPKLKALQCKEILRRVSEGESLTRICRDEDMPALTTANDWLWAEYSEEYARARDQRAEAIFEETLEIADDGTGDMVIDPETGLERLNNEHVQRSRLRVDTRKWMLGKMSPKKYGDKLDVEHTGKDGGPVEVEHKIDAIKELGAVLERLAESGK